MFRTAAYDALAYWQRLAFQTDRHRNLPQTDANATELIQGLAIAMQMGATETDLINTVFPHPTLSEMIHESALNAQSRAIHM